MHQATALTEFNFNVPYTLAAGQKRDYGLLRKAFVLILGINGQRLPALLKEQYSAATKLTLFEKRNGLKQLATEIRRLHELGFVHGCYRPTSLYPAR
jgi:hypothetical protein